MKKIKHFELFKKELKSIYEQPKHGYGQLYFQATGDYSITVAGTMRLGYLCSRTSI